MLLIVSSSILLFACSGGGICNDNVPLPPLDIDYQIDYVGTIPVVNGAATSSYFYVHNDGDITLSNISYTLAGAANTVQNSNDGNISDDRGFTLDSSSLAKCSILLPHTSCEIKFTTPSLSLGNQNNSLLIVNVPDSNGFNHRYEQVLNYSYYSANVLTGVDFVGSANVIANLGTKRYMTAYLIGGAGSNVIYDDVILHFSLDNILVINQGFVNGSQVAANELIPVEFEAKLSSSGVTPLSITPQYIVTELSSQNSTASLVKSNVGGLTVSSGQGLFVNTSTNLNSALGIKLGSIPLLTNGDSTVVYVSSFSYVGQLQISLDNANISISDNTCNSGIESNASCSFKLTAQSDAVGTTLINFMLPDSAEEVFSEEINFGPRVEDMAIDTPRLISNTPLNMLTLLVNEQSSVINFVFSNIGNTGLNNLTITPHIGNGANMNIINNQCADIRLAPNTQCLVQVSITGGNNISEGHAWLSVDATTDGNKAYTSQSNIINYLIVGGGLYISSPIGATVTLVVNGDGYESQSAVFVVSNSSTREQVINNISITGVAVPVNLQITGSTCTTLSGGESCSVTVKYGPMLLESNVNGVANLTVNYGESQVLQGKINYSGLGMDSSLVISNVSVNGFISGDGSVANPYHALGCENSTPQIILTYTNQSVNYVIDKLSLNTIDSNISPYMSVDSALSTCGYGSHTTSLGIGQSCNLVLNANKEWMKDNSGYQLNVVYPQASWQTSRGFLYQDNFIYNSSSVLYANYIQPVLTSSISPNAGSSLVRELTQVLSNMNGCSGSITTTISSPNFNPVVAPEILEGNCIINSDLTISCTNNGINNINKINYMIPDNIPEAVDMFFMFNVELGKQVWLNPALLLFYVSK